MIFKKTTLTFVSLLGFACPSLAVSWEPLYYEGNVINEINKDSIRSYPGVVFAIISEKYPSIPITFYQRALFMCGSRELFKYLNSMEYPFSPGDLEPSEPELVHNPKYQFEIGNYCSKEKSSEDIEAPIAVNEKSFTTVMLPETKISGGKVSLWTNNYQLTKKPEIHKGKQVVRDGQKQYKYAIDKSKGVTVINNILDCKNGTFISKQLIKYDGNGKVVESFSTPTDNMTPTPRTIGGQVFKFGCALVK